MENLTQVSRKTLPQPHTGHLLYKATLADTTDLPKHMSKLQLKQTSMSKIKEQNRTLEKDLSKMKINNLSDAEYKTLVISILNK